MTVCHLGIDRINEDEMFAGAFLFSRGPGKFEKVPKVPNTIEMVASLTSKFVIPVTCLFEN